ncbi:MAG: RuBisCO accumulation factor 1 [Prochlorotrichaceae cyanobacterium]|jgi:hypothetical protein
MTESNFPPFTIPGNTSPLDRETCNTLLLMLRRKEQTWVDWGKACQLLQRSGYNSGQIFEETGLEPIQQNQVMVAAQVYESMLKVGLDASTQTHFQHRGSDLLYELRGLTPQERSQAACFAYQHQFDLDQTRELAKAYKDFTRLKDCPEGLTNHPGDALAYQYWRWAKERSELQERSRFIALGLKVAHSEAARQKLQDLLADWTPQVKQNPPRWPIYRLESGDSFPRILPLLGCLPLESKTIAGLQTRLETLAQNPFAALHITLPGTYVGIPGWSIFNQAGAPFALQCQVADLPHMNALAKDLDLSESDPLLLIVDRDQCEWQPDRFFVVDRGGQLGVEWFPVQPLEALCGAVLLVLRPPRAIEIAEGDDGDWLLAE